MERGLLFVTFPDLDVAEPPPDIEFCEEPGSLQMVNKVVDQRERVPIFHSHRVECPVILDEPEGSVFLLNEENRRCHRRFRWTDAAGTQPLRNEGIELLLFERGDQVDLAVCRLRVRDEFNGMVSCSLLRQRVEGFLVEDV
jgi:hypothetical protein